MILLAQADPNAEFKSWAAYYGKSYVEGSDEFQQRLGHWKANVAHSLQKENSLFHDVNGLMHLHDEEFAAGFLGHSKRQIRYAPHICPDSTTLTFASRRDDWSASILKLFSTCVC